MVRRKKSTRDERKRNKEKKKKEEKRKKDTVVTCFCPSLASSTDRKDVRFGVKSFELMREELAHILEDHRADAQMEFAGRETATRRRSRTEEGEGKRKET